MTEIITVRNKRTAFGGKKDCPEYLNPDCFPKWPHNSCADSREQPFKELLPAHCLASARMAVCVGPQRTAARPQTDCWGKVSGSGIGFACRFHSAVTQKAVQKRGPVMEAAQRA